jgi:hypothetical protein
VVLIPPLLFSQAGLQGPLVALKTPRLAGTEEVDGRHMHKLVGDVDLTYATGLGRACASHHGLDRRTDPPGVEDRRGHAGRNASWRRESRHGHLPAAGQSPTRRLALSVRGSGRRKVAARNRVIGAARLRAR